MMQEFLSDLSYCVLPAQGLNENIPYDLYNSSYKFWKSVWEPALAQMNSMDLSKDEWLRQHYIAILLHKNEIIGSHLYTVYDLEKDVCWESNYLAGINKDLKDFSEKWGVKKVLSQEYLSIVPKFRKSVSQVSLPEVMVGLAGKIMLSSGCDATSGTVREGAPSVARVCREIGCELLPTTIIRYDIKHEFYIVPKQKLRHPGSPETHQQIERLWREKTDYAGIDFNRVAQAA